MFRKILVGFDGSADAYQAVRVATSMAVTLSGQALIVAVVPRGRGETEEARRAAFDAEAEPLRRLAEHELAVLEGSGTRCRVKILPGERPGRVLEDYAEQHGYDLLVVGRHGRERASHGGLGRVARGLVEHARSPVLLVGDGDPGSGRQW